MDVEEVAFRYGLGALGVVTAFISAFGLEKKINRLIDYHLGDLASEEVRPEDRIVSRVIVNIFAAGFTLCLWISAIQYFFPRFWKRIEFFKFEHRLALEWYLLYAFCVLTILSAAALLVFLCRRMPGGTLAALGLLLAIVGFTGILIS